MSAKYACSTRHRREFPVTLMCRVLAVSPSGYYSARQRVPSAHAARDEQLLVAIRVEHGRSRRRYGAPRIYRELRAAGTPVSRKRVARLMRTDGLRGRRPHRFVCTTDSGHGEPLAPNTLAQGFAPATMGGPDRVWASDIMYLRTRRGWLYLAIVLDLATRRVIGWQTGITLGEELVLEALTQALRGRQPPPGWCHHSDRGSQPICRSGLPRPRARARGIAQHESTRELLRQRGRGKFLRDAEGRAGGRNRLGGPGRCPPGPVRLYRGVVQSPTAALDARLSQPGSLRGNPR